MEAWTESLRESNDAAAAAEADALGEGRLLRLRRPNPRPSEVILSIQSTSNPRRRGRHLKPCEFSCLCSGHTAVSIGKSKVVVFGGFADKRFLSDIAVYDVGNKPHRLLRLIASATIQTIDSV